jgi:hypothetical protein
MPSKYGFTTEEEFNARRESEQEAITSAIQQAAERNSSKVIEILEDFCDASGLQDWEVSNLWCKWIALN